ncbi:hypothetical protein LB505_007537 [Fusarium chuoi]|nr:hypothetical protein LB505_007537 [Fusarium chuoi]
MIELGGNVNAEEDARSQALAFLIQCVRYRRMKIQGMKDMAAELMVKAMHIVTELDADDDEEDISPARTAISLIDTLLLFLSSSNSPTSLPTTIPSSVWRLCSLSVTLLRVLPTSSPLNSSLFSLPSSLSSRILRLRSDMPLLLV